MYRTIKELTWLNIPNAIHLLGDLSADFLKLDSNRIEIPLPGVKKESVSVEMTQDGKITIKYKDRTDEDQEVTLRTKGFEDASAKYADGLLTIQLKEKELKKKQIKID